MFEKLSLLNAERSVLVEKAALWNKEQGRKIPADYIEKDFWVTEALRSLAIPFIHELDGTGGGNAGILQANIIFKGGTSLSKAYRLINRFSEDIDLFVVISFQRKQTTKMLQPAPIEDVGAGRADTTFGMLAERVGSDIGLTVEPYVDKDARTGLRRAYQADYAGEKNVVGALKPVILIELTRMGNPQPNEAMEIESLLANYVREAGMPDADFVEFSPVSVMVLSPHRTLIEKLCLLEHAGLQIETDSRGFTNIARHFYDVGCLLTAPSVVAALMREDVSATAQNHYELSSQARRSTAVRPNRGFAFSSWIINNEVANKAKEAYDVELPDLAYSGHPSFGEIQDIVKASASFL